MAPPPFLSRRCFSFPSFFRVVHLLEELRSFTISLLLLSFISSPFRFLSPPILLAPLVQPAPGQTRVGPFAQLTTHISAPLARTEFVIFSGAGHP